MANTSYTSTMNTFQKDSSRLRVQASKHYLDVRGPDVVSSIATQEERGAENSLISL